MDKRLWQGDKGFQNCLSRQFSVADAGRKHRAGALVRMNLPPLMGRRDAVLDAAETLLDIADKIADSRVVFSYLNGLFAAADDNTARISGMFNNSDTAARERRLSIHIGILAKLAASLDEFAMLNAQMHAAAAFYADDPGNEFDPECTGRINERMSAVEKNLFAQLREYYSRVRARIARYRQYAVKNFSKEYWECYRKSYLSVMERCNVAFKQFSVQISTPKVRSFFDEKLPD